MNPSPDQHDRRLAYALLRILLGVNIALHGIARLLGGPSHFESKIEAQFAHSPLPHPALVAFAVILPWVEAFLGFFLLLGLATRLALIGGSLLLILLTFGVCLVQDWSAAGTQLLYGIAYALLLFLRGYNGWSLDAWRERRSRS